jgi:hypothetical protein
LRRLSLDGGQCAGHCTEGCRVDGMERRGVEGEDGEAGRAGVEKDFIYIEDCRGESTVERSAR